jgi:hypothetical protein
MAATTPASPCSFLKQQLNSQQDCKYAAMFGYLEAKCSSKMVHADTGKQAANNICPGFSCNLAEEV